VTASVRSVTARQVSVGTLGQGSQAVDTMGLPAVAPRRSGEQLPPSSDTRL